MRKIMLVIGLPGSGKTFFAHEMFPDALIIDDPVDIQKDLPPPDQEFDMMVITDPHLCRYEIFEKAVPMLITRYNANVAAVFFENDPEAAKANVRLRNDGRKVDGMIDMLTKTYNPPDNMAMPIWRMN